MTSSSSSAPSVSCNKCQSQIPSTLWNLQDAVSCSVCGSELRVLVFPKLFHGMAEGKQPEVILVDGDAGCFYHPGKKAEVTCDYCGRFLCALCDVDWSGKHLCPPCIESGKRQKSIGTLENRRVLYDQIALSLAILPMLLFYFTFITAPVSLFVAIRYWNHPGSIVRRTKWRFVLAIVISALQIIGWGALIFFLISRL